MKPAKNTPKKVVAAVKKADAAPPKIPASMPIEPEVELNLNSSFH